MEITTLGIDLATPPQRFETIRKAAAKSCREECKGRGEG